jgi:hypothetical protein
MKLKTEAKIQQEIFMYFYSTYPKYSCHSVPNGFGVTIPKIIPDRYHKAIRIMIAGAVDLLKNMGMKPGVSDLMVHLPGGRCVCVEVKNETNKQDPDQIKFENKIKAMNGNYILVRSLEDFQKQITPFIFNSLER